MTWCLCCSGFIGSDERAEVARWSEDQLGGYCQPCALNRCDERVGCCPNRVRA